MIDRLEVEFANDFRNEAGEVVFPEPVLQGDSQQQRLIKSTGSMESPRESDLPKLTGSQATPPFHGRTLGDVLLSQGGASGDGTLEVAETFVKRIREKRNARPSAEPPVTVIHLQLAVA